MKSSTGIVRRIDDLGRVVVPKEIRRAMKIDEGDALEIFTNLAHGEITLKKYNEFSPIEEKQYNEDFLKLLRTQASIVDVVDLINLRIEAEKQEIGRAHV